MIELILNDLDKFSKGDIPASKLFKDVPFFKVKPIRFDTLYLPRANRFEIGFSRLRDNCRDKEQQLFLLTHEICHIVQRKDFDKNLSYTNLGLDWENMDSIVQIEKEVLGLQYALYKEMNWDLSIFDWVRFGIGYGRVGVPSDIVDLSLTFENFTQLTKEKISTLVKRK
jgi:hypothetical protein